MKRSYFFAILIVLAVSLAGLNYNSLRHVYPSKSVEYFQSKLNSNSADVLEVGEDFVIFEDENGVWIVQFEE